MSNQSTIELLREMKFSAMASEFIAQLEDPSSYKDLDFEERFSLLVDAEWNRRRNNWRGGNNRRRRRHNRRGRRGNYRRGRNHRGRGGGHYDRR